MANLIEIGILLVVNFLLKVLFEASQYTPLLSSLFLQADPIVGLNQMQWDIRLQQEDLTHVVTVLREEDPVPLEIF